MDELRSPLAVYPSDTTVGQQRSARRTLAGIIGALAAGTILTLVPQEESGRTVKVDIDSRGAARVTHVAGRQYLKAYRDVAGVATACDGITKGVRIGQSYSEAQCAALLERELVVHAEGMLACSPGLRRPGWDYPRAAALSLTYNIGVGGFCRSRVRQLFDAGNLIGACNAFLSWNKARVKGRLQALPGLTTRRTRERALCLKGVV